MYKSIKDIEPKEMIYLSDRHPRIINYIPEYNMIGANSIENLLHDYRLYEEAFLKGYAFYYHTDIERLNYWIDRQMFEQYNAVYKKKGEDDKYFIIIIEEGVFRPGEDPMFHAAYLYKETLRKAKGIPEEIDIDNFFRNIDDISDPSEKLYWTMYSMKN